MTSDLTPAVRRLLRMRPRRVPGPAASDPEVAVIDETTLDLDRHALEVRVHAAENRLLCTQAALDAVIDHTRRPHFGASLTREELVGLFRDYLLEVYADVIGVKTS